VLGIVLLLSGAMYFSRRPDPQGPFAIEMLEENQAVQDAVRSRQGESPTNLSAVALGGRSSNQSVRAGSATELSNSNWDAITAGLQKDGDSTELATRANALLSAGDPPGAVRVLEEALRLTPDSEDLHYNLGIAYGQSGNVTNAEHHYREALRLLPDYPEVHNNLGNLLLRAGRLGEAEEQFVEAIKLMPELSSAHNSLGIVRQNQKRMPEAIACFRKAVQYNTNYWQAHFNLAVASLSQGLKDEGAQELQTVLRLKPGYAPAQRALDQLLAQPSKP
jgi:Tfp pilus assembly protein PilF